MFSTLLKNMSQWEELSHISWKIKNGWNHQPVLYQYLKHLNIWADRSTHTHIFQWSLVSVKMTILQSNIKRTFSNYTQLEILWTNYSREYNFQIQSIPKTCWIWLRMFHREGPSPRMEHWEHAKGLLQIFRINAVSCELNNLSEIGLQGDYDYYYHYDN